MWAPGRRIRHPPTSAVRHVAGASVPRPPYMSVAHKHKFQNGTGCTLTLPCAAGTRVLCCWALHASARHGMPLSWRWEAPIRHGPAVLAGGGVGRRQATHPPRQETCQRRSLRCIPILEALKITSEHRDCSAGLWSSDGLHLNPECMRPTRAPPSNAPALTAL